MAYTAKDYSSLIGTPGFSKALLENHFTLYQGYVAATNKLLHTLTAMLAEDRTATPEYSELKRRLGWEFDGMRLHELYFGNLGTSALTPGGRLVQRMAVDFGSYENWEKDFRATAAMRGVGWTILCQDPTNGRLANFWINEHDVAHPAGCAPLLILDVFEHAFMLDYGLKRADYVTAFFKNINWQVVERRARE